MVHTNQFQRSVQYSSPALHSMQSSSPQSSTAIRYNHEKPYKPTESFIEKKKKKKKKKKAHTCCLMTCVSNMSDCAKEIYVFTYNSVMY